LCADFKIDFQEEKGVLYMISVTNIRISFQYNQCYMITNYEITLRLINIRSAMIDTSSHRMK